MMINNKICQTLACLFFILINLNVSAQIDKQKVSIGMFDNDNISDTLYYQFSSGTSEGPVYQCRLISPGKHKVYQFSIGVSTSSLQISDCGNGCIETYEWIIGMNGSETMTRYKYNIKYDNWIMTEEIVNDKKVKHNEKYLLGIDGKKYCRNKHTNKVFGSHSKHIAP